MKNRNKRFTSVLAASMALGMMAPAMVSVAPVMAMPASAWTGITTFKDYNEVKAAADGYNVGTYVATGTTQTGLTYNIYNNPNAGASFDTVGDYVAVLVDGSNFKSQESALVLGPTITVPKAGNNGVYEATLVGIANNAFRTSGVIGTACNTNISSVTVVGDSSNPVVIGNFAFANNTSITSVSLTNVKSIGDYAFGNGTSFAAAGGNIKSVTFAGDTLTSIGEYAFAKQKGLTKIEIPNSVKVIGTSAFQGTGLTGTINLPSSLTNLGAQSFDTTAPSLSLEWPTENGKDKAGVTVNMPFAAAGVTDSTYYRVIGISETAPAAYPVLNKVWVGCPSISVFAGYDTIAPGDKITENTNVKVPLSTTLTIAVEKAGTLKVDGNVVGDWTYNPTGQYHKYTMVTPKLGSHTVTFTNLEGVTRSITVTVVEYNNNQWIEGNFNIPNPWVVGTEEEPSGAVAKYGTVYYVYSTTKNGEYHVEKPAYPGTWWVKAKVDGSATYNGLQTAAQSFQVIAAADINTGWVESGDNWMYKEDGEFVTSALKEIDGDTYLFDSEGVMVTGWAKNDTTNGNWMFFDNAGHAKKGWLNDNGTWYYLDSNAVMVANEWVKDAGKDYFLTDNGAMAVSRWLTKDGHDVYVDNSGALKTGWLAWNMNWYYLEPSTGYMATSGTVDGWNIQSNGIAVKA